MLLKCNNTLDLCSKWLYANKLTLNIDKTHFVDFSQKKDCNVPKTLKIQNTIIKEQDSTKYLGMIIQGDLKWTKHINYLINKINSKIPLYYQIRNIFTINNKKIIYNSLTLSQIIYGIELYGKKNNLDLKRLQKCQNRILKLLFNRSFRTNTCFLYKSLNLLKLTDIANLRTMLISHKVIHENEKTNVAHRNMILNRTGRNLRQTNNFQISATFYETNNKVTENARILWNNLPNEYKTIKNRASFKDKIKYQHILPNYN